MGEVRGNIGVYVDRSAVSIPLDFVPNLATVCGIGVYLAQLQTIDNQSSCTMHHANIQVIVNSTPVGFRLHRYIENRDYQALFVSRELTSRRGRISSPCAVALAIVLSTA